MRKAEVCQLEMTVPVDEDIVWLDVPVDNALVMQVLEGNDNLCHVLPSPVLGKCPNFLKQRVAVTSLHILHDEVETVSALE